jgi:hypothetical protein
MGTWKTKVMMDDMIGCKFKHYTTSWVCDLHLDYTFNYEVHMLLMTYGLFDAPPNSLLDPKRVQLCQKAEVIGTWCHSQLLALKGVRGAC